MSNNSYQRSPARRVLAAELDVSDYHFKESDDEYAPNYLLLPSGGRANRVLVGGTLTSLEDQSNEDDSAFWKARVTDSTGEFRLYAGQYEKEAASVFREIDESDDSPPAFVLASGKTTEYRPEDDESEVIVNIRPERVAVVSKQQRNQWLFDAAQATLNRLQQSDGDDVRQAEDRYGNRAKLLQEDVVTALENVETEA